MTRYRPASDPCQAVTGKSRLATVSPPLFSSNMSGVYGDVGGRVFSDAMHTFRSVLQSRSDSQAASRHYSNYSSTGTTSPNRGDEVRWPSRHPQ
jgi:hypothetical protein